MSDDEEDEEEEEETEQVKYVCKSCKQTFYEDEEHDFCKGCWPKLSTSDKVRLKYGNGQPKSKIRQKAAHRKGKKRNWLKAFLGGEINA